MDSMADLLGKYNPGGPEEILVIKRYIAEEFGAPASVGVQGESLVITVASASLANTLRMRLPAIQAAAGTKKRLIFRIG
jgi:hypothetical protein